MTKQYLENKVMSASKEELLIMLFDGAISFAEQSKVKIAEKMFEEKNEMLVKSQKIVVELMCSLQKDNVVPELYQNLMKLYNFVYFKLVWGNLKNDTKLIEEAILILNHLRMSYHMAIEKNKQEEARNVPQSFTIQQSIKIEPEFLPQKNLKIALDLEG